MKYIPYRSPLTTFLPKPPDRANTIVIHCGAEGEPEPLWDATQCLHPRLNSVLAPAKHNKRRLSLKCLTNESNMIVTRRRSNVWKTFEHGCSQRSSFSMRPPPHLAQLLDNTLPTWTFAWHVYKYRRPTRDVKRKVDGLFSRSRPTSRHPFVIKR